MGSCYWYLHMMVRHSDDKDCDDAGRGSDDDEGGNYSHSDGDDN